MKETSWFNGSIERDEEGIVKQTGNSILKVGTLVGAGVLLGLGIGVVTGD